MPGIAQSIQSLKLQNHGEGWPLPETLRLSDYNLGYDNRAQRHQPVARALSPRFRRASSTDTTRWPDFQDESGTT